jgi:exodeoxyribonuclease VII large subunit
VVDAEVEEPTPGVVRAVRATALGRGTQSVPDLRRLVEGALHTAFPHRTWVAGRVGGVRAEHGTGLHFLLLAPGDDDEPFQLPCLLSDEALPQVAEVLDRLHDADLDDLVAEDRLLRAGGLLRYDFARGTLVFLVSELDPTPTALGLREEREAARALVREHALSERQRARACRVAPLSVSLIGAPEDPAVARVRELLLDSPYAVDLRDVRVQLQGRRAPADVAGAVREAGLRSDVVLLVREQGRPLTLSVFDAPEVSFALAQSPVPVVSALGGAGETTAVDDVAHVSLPDGEAAARWLLDRLAAAHSALDTLRADVDELASAAADRARDDLDRAARDADATGTAAAARAAASRHRVRTRLLVLSAVLAVALVVAAFALGQPLVLLGLAVLAAALLGARAWSGRAMTRGSKPMSQQDDEFVAVLARLREVRDQLATTSSPKTVHRLRDAARQLVAHGEQILARTVGPAASTPVLDGPTVALPRPHGSSRLDAGRVPADA